MTPTCLHGRTKIVCQTIPDLEYPERFLWSEFVQVCATCGERTQGIECKLHDFVDWSDYGGGTLCIKCWAAAPPPPPDKGPPITMMNTLKLLRSSRTFLARRMQKP